MPSFFFKLPIKPISVNGLYAVSRGRKVLSKQAREFKLKTHELISKQWNKPPIKTKVSVDLEFYFKTKRERDVDNYIKCIFDCMSGVVLEDDKQVQSVHARKIIDAPHDEVLICVTPEKDKTKEEPLGVLDGRPNPFLKKTWEETTKDFEKLAQEETDKILEKVDYGAHIPDIRFNVAVIGAGDNNTFVCNKPGFSDPQWKDPRQPFWQDEKEQQSETKV